MIIRNIIQKRHTPYLLLAILLFCSCLCVFSTCHPLSHLIFYIPSIPQPATISCHFRWKFMQIILVSTRILRTQVFLDVNKKKIPRISFIAVYWVTIYQKIVGELYLKIRELPQKFRINMLIALKWINRNRNPLPII